MMLTGGKWGEASCAHCNRSLGAAITCPHCGFINAHVDSDGEALAEQEKQEPLMDYERINALREGEQNGAEDAYFFVRPENDTPSLRTMFCQGFERGFHKGLKYAAPVEPVKQEPVAWAYFDADGTFMDALDRQHGAYQTPLYAAPVSAKREWVDLTDDEIDLIEQQVYCRTTQKGRPLGVYAVELVRAVITAFKEKNK